ncbi:ABC transporter ATP-binding protein [Paenibacillaceae bacterium]|nr:ABC transporter ATP-binding protein [Paenibacillaceae bacterium]
MLELSQVWKMYPKGQVGLYHVSAAIQSGEIVGILGGNGSGKTTLLKAIMGLGDLNGGKVLLDGRPVGEQYERVAFITEEGSYLPGMTPYEYGEFLADYYSRFSWKRYERLLKFFELESNHKIRSFSKGQKSKLEISAGFAKEADLVLMDEPFLGKDMFARRDFLKLMLSSLRGEETILIATHLIDEIEHVLDRALILRSGEIRADFYIDDMRQEGVTLEERLAQITGYEADRYKQAAIDGDL